MRMKRPSACAAVDKIEEKRKPEDFIGHRKREEDAPYGNPQKTISVIRRKLERDFPKQS